MKTLLFCLLLAGPAFSQGIPAPGAEAPAPFKGANTLLLHTADTAALRTLARLLVLEGYAMDKYDAALGYLTTKGKPVGQLTPAVYTYTVAAVPGGLRIKGEYAVPVGLRTLTESMYWTKSNLPHAKQCFSAIEKVVLAYPAGRVGYLLQP